MRILIVASYNKGYFVPFVREQGKALQQVGCEVDYFGIVGKGFSGYLKSFSVLKKKIKEYRPDIIHAHYGLSGLLANLQRRIPVVTTYHGSDINVPNLFCFSKIAMLLSAYNIFVSQRNIDIAQPRNKYTLLPCGVDLTDDQLQSRSTARELLGIAEDEKIILFAGAFDNVVKDASLAQEVVMLLNKAKGQSPNINRLIELKGYSRTEVNTWMCAANCLLLTSKTEGSPQVVKEAMACSCPIVSVDVGDVAERVSGVDGCYVVPTREPADIAEVLFKAIAYDGKTNGREQIFKMGLSNEQVAARLIKLYNQVCV